MPMMELGLPVGATALKITVNGRDYSILLDTATFDRTGEDGDIPILPLCRGCEYVGEVLPGEWKKGWTDTFDADQAFTAIIDSGLLKFKGEADVAGTWGYGWIKSMHPVPMMNETEVTVELEVPINDVAAGVNRALYFRFFLSQNNIVTERPSLNDNTIFIEISVTHNGLLMTVAKSIEDADDDLFTGSTYDDASTRSETAEKFTVWRIVFHDAVAGADSPEDVNHMHVYLKQGVDRATAEDAAENELTTSPYDISDILFDVGYPAYQINSQNADYFDDGTEAVSTYFRVNYPSLFSLKYDFADADVGKGDCEIWDGDPGVSTSVQVFDEDHVFNNDPYLQNGLIRAIIQETDGFGFNMFYYSGAAWIGPQNNIYVYLDGDVTNLDHPFLQKIIQISSEKVIIEFLWMDDATDDRDQFVRVEYTMRRGSLYGELKITEVSPLQQIEFRYFDATKDRFGYAGDNRIADDDLGLNGQNTIMTDNFGESFDEAQTAVLTFVSSNKEPDNRISYNDGGFLRWEEIETSDIGSVIMYLGFTPFSLIANLFIEAEDGGNDIGDADTVNDANASPPGGAPNTVRLNAIGDYTAGPPPTGEYATYAITAGDDLPEGRYLATIRAARIGTDTMEMYVWNDTDDEYRNEENQKVTQTLTLNFNSTNYESVVFDITAADVDDKDTLVIVAEKTTSDTQEIRIDYFLIIPIGDGESFPQDLSHAAMRNFNKPKRLCVR